jgi:hypothetical protein
VQVFSHARHGLPLSHGSDCAATLLAFLARRAGDEALAQTECPRQPQRHLRDIGDDDEGKQHH